MIIIFSDVSEMWLNKNRKESSIADIFGEYRSDDPKTIW